MPDNMHQMVARGAPVAAGPDGWATRTSPDLCLYVICIAAGGFSSRRQLQHHLPGSGSSPGAGSSGQEGPGHVAGAGTAAPRPPREAASWSEGLRSCGARGRAGRLCLHRVPGCGRAGAAGEGWHCLTPSPSLQARTWLLPGCPHRREQSRLSPTVSASPGCAAPGAVRCAPRGAGSSTAPGPRTLPEQRQAQLPVPEAVEQRLGINDCVYEARNVASKISHSAQRRRANGRLFMALPCCCRSSAAPAARPRTPAQDPPCIPHPALELPSLGGPGRRRELGTDGGSATAPPRAGAAAGAAPDTHGGAVQGGHHPCHGAWSLRQPCQAATVMGTEEQRGGGRGQAVALVLWVTFCQ